MLLKAYDLHFEDHMFPIVEDYIICSKCLFEKPLADENDKFRWRSVLDLSKLGIFING